MFHRNCLLNCWSYPFRYHHNPQNGLDCWIIELHNGKIFFFKRLGRPRKMVAFKVLIVLISIYLALEISEAKRLNKNFRRHIVKRQNDGSYGSSSQNGNLGSQQGSNGNQNGGNTNSNQNGGNTNNNQTSGTINNNTKQNGTDSSIYSFFQQLLQSIGYGPTAAPTTTTTTTPGPIVVTNSTQTNATTPRPNSAMLKTVSMGSVVAITIFGVFFSRFF